jgi:hypothetical protein
MAIRTDLTNSDISTSIVDNFDIVDLNEYSNTQYDQTSTDVVVQADNHDVVDITTSNKDRVAEIDTFNANDYLAEYDNGTKEVISSGASNNDKEEKSNVDEVGVTAFELLQELDLIRVPEGAELTVETLKAFADNTRVEQFNEALDFIKTSASHDPYMADLVEYALEGRGFADIPYFQETLGTEKFYAELDLTLVANQEQIVYDYLTQGLNPEDKRDKQLLALIPGQIEGFKKANTLLTEAEEARKIFVDNEKRLQQEEYDRVVAQRAEQEKQLVVQKELEQLWDKEFKKVLNSDTYTKEQKEIIGKRSYEVVKYNGTEMLDWQMRQNIVMDNPALFQKMLLFLSGVDVEKKTFTDSKLKDENIDNLPKSTVNKIIDRLNKKSGTDPKPTSSKPADVDMKNKKQINVGIDFEY